ncbi:MAG: prepilin-type N-terminal cleavage/methylation domain-containing protein [Planctomycetes bacterium]|nr:prepilin-type N-terminal cleavage/methylation domain-containing protein [Planctomycetota bacterium]
MHRCEGFTLVEVIIVMSILTVMIGGAMYVLFSGQEIFDEGSTTSFLESQAARLIDKIKDDISEGLVITTSKTINPMFGDWEIFPCITTSYVSLAIRVPVQVGGNYWDPATGAVYWGAYDSINTPQQNYFVWYTFWLRTPLNESIDRKDYNQDGDLNDTFFLCDLYETLYTEWWGWPANPRWNCIMSNIIITWWPDPKPYYGDINGDGIDDPVFTLLDKDGNVIQDLATTGSAKRLRLNFWLGGKLGAKGNPILVNTKTEITLINPQQ